MSDDAEFTANPASCPTCLAERDKHVELIGGSCPVCEYEAEG